MPIPQLPEDVFNSLPQAVQVYIRYLEDLVRQQQVQTQQLNERVLDLEKRLVHGHR